MSPLLTGYFEEFTKIFADLETAIVGLPLAALDWVPGAEMNSISVLTTHTAGSVRYWANDVALGKGSTQRQRATEFLAHGNSAEQLRQLLTTALDDVHVALDSLNEEELGLLRTTPTEGNQVSVSWALAHALAHTATHLGHIQLSRQLWEQSQS